MINSILIDYIFLLVVTYEIDEMFRNFYKILSFLITIRRKRIKQTYIKTNFYKLYIYYQRIQKIIYYLSNNTFLLLNNFARVFFSFKITYNKRKFLFVYCTYIVVSTFLGSFDRIHFRTCLNGLCRALV